MASEGISSGGSRRGRKKVRHDRVRLSKLWIAAVFVTVVMILCDETHVRAAPVMSTNQTMIVSKTLLVGPCVDDTGTEVGDQTEWSTGCNRIVCHAEPSGNYTVKHGCRNLVPSENPDTTNCVTVQNSMSTYPNCCPVLQCGVAPAYSTLSPSACYDLSPLDSCQKWMELSNNCSDTTAFVYNFTQIFCRSSCGLCSGGFG